MRAKPWMSVDLMTGEVIGWYENEVEAAKNSLGKAVSIQYRPGRKKAVKK